jgi:hypothetical protein
MPTSLLYQLVGVNKEKFNSSSRNLGENGRYVDEYGSRMSKLGIFRFELVSIALIPLATTLVLAGFEGLRRIQRYRRERGTPASIEGVATAFASDRGPVRSARLFR